MIKFFKNLLTRKARDREVLQITLEALHKSVKELSAYMKEKDEAEDGIMTCLTAQGEAQLAMLDEIRLFVNTQKGMIENISKYMKLEVTSKTMEIEHPPEIPKPTEHDLKF